MENEQTPNRIEQTAKDLFDYVNLRIDRMKLKSVEDFSIFFNRLFFVFLFVIILSIALLFFTVAFTWWLGMMIGSTALALVLVGSGFVVAAIILFMMRSHLIINQLVILFSKMLFNGDETDKKE